jgi:25S rRNA (uracil2634-N3)-methyltransferase
MPSTKNHDRIRKRLRKESQSQSVETKSTRGQVDNNQNRQHLERQNKRGRDHPYRNMKLNLHTPLPTLQCAMDNECIPCSYKIATFDIALDSSFTKHVPNTRPEMCPRSNGLKSHGATYSYGYKRGMRVLTVGDGDFSFSLALARILSIHGPSTSKKKKGKSKSEKKSKHGVLPELIATSYESYDTLRKVYPNIQETIDELMQLNVKIFYEVDATDLQTTLPIDVPESDDGHFNRIIWNFPCTAIANGQDGQNQQMQENQMLVKRFVKQCVHYLHPILGEIHFLHKTKPPYDQWGLEKVAVEDCSREDAATSGKSELESVSEQQRVWSDDCPCPFEYKGRVVFDKCLLPPYTPRKALDKKSFPCHDACLYAFGWKERGDGDQRSKKANFDIKTSFPSTIPVNQGDDSKNEMGRSNVGVVPVTEELIDKIRSLHLSLGSSKERKKRKLQQR